MSEKFIKNSPENLKSEWLSIMTMRENSKPSKKYKTKNYLLGFSEQSRKVNSQFPLTSIPVFNTPLQLKTPGTGTKMVMVLFQLKD